MQHFISINRFYQKLLKENKKFLWGHRPKFWLFWYYFAHNFQTCASFGILKAIKKNCFWYGTFQKTFRIGSYRVRPRSIHLETAETHFFWKLAKFHFLSKKNFKIGWAYQKLIWGRKKGQNFGATPCLNIFWLVTIY